MSETRPYTLWGGPYDGRAYELEDGREVRIHVPVEADGALNHKVWGVYKTCDTPGILKWCEVTNPSP